MSGFDNGSMQRGAQAYAKQLGSVLRGFGPPIPAVGVVGDLYLDTQTFFIYENRADNVTDPWGHYLFQVPAAYQASLKWFSSSLPANSIGITGDYCLLWGGYPNYGTQPSICGPKLASGWAENGAGPDTQIDAIGADTGLSVGLVDEGAALGYSASTQIVVAGLIDEYILAIPVSDDAGTPVSQAGLQSSPASVTVVSNPLYTSQDQHTV